MPSGPALSRRRLRLERQLRDERGPVTTLWSGRPVEVHAALHLQGWLGLPYVAIADRLPFGTELHAGQAEAEGRLQAGKALESEIQRAPVRRRAGSGSKG